MTLKEKPDYCKISRKMLVENWSLVGETLYTIVNSSLEAGEFPDCWKETMVTPIKKVENTLKCEEFRYINSLKTVEKFLEKVVKEQLERYLDEYSIISKYQSGYRKKFSCETAVNYVINRWKKIEKNKKIMVVFLTFKRSFDTIGRNMLVEMNGLIFFK